jgi:hypothetical protein
VVSCVDFRFRPKVAAIIADELSDQADLAAVAGCSNAVIDPSSRETVLNQIAIATKLHEVKTVDLFDHIDCGAYGGSKIFDTKEDEIEMHRSRLHEARDIIKERFPKLNVTMKILDFDEAINVA